MAKIQIKKDQLAKAAKLGGLKGKLTTKKPAEPSKKPSTKKEKSAPSKAKAKKDTTKSAVVKEETIQPPLQEEANKTAPRPRARARSRSVFAEQEEETKATPELPIEPEVKTPAPPLKPVEPTTEPIVDKEPPPPPEPEPLKTPKKETLGPTGRHIKDLLPPKPPPPPPSETAKTTPEEKLRPAPASDKRGKPAHFKEFRDVKPSRKQDEQRRFDTRDKRGLRGDDEGTQWKKRRAKGPKVPEFEETTIRPTELTIRIPIALRDLAAQMKLKASQLITKLFQQGVVMTLNDALDDETTLQLLGEEFGCAITLDTTEEERIRITDKTIAQEIQEDVSEKLTPRPPVVAFMGHVDHGKTSLIDKIRQTNTVSGEAGAITQHIGAFLCATPVGNIAILDTPGHEAFSAMRARGADVTDIVVLVIAGDEGMRQQTIEAVQHAKAAGVTIVVAINKCDKPNFNAENIYRQLSENELLPEAWGGSTITVNCSALTGEGVKELLEMLALQSEVLELKANPEKRARGRVLESKMQKGLGAAATLLIQNGTLKLGDAVVFDLHWGRVKTMRDEFGKSLNTAGPSSPIEISGLSASPEAGSEFIVVSDEKEARDISNTRLQEHRQKSFLQTRSLSLESLLQQSEEAEKKVLNIVLRADVQGSLEALKNALLKIESEKVELNIIFTGVGEISEADVQLAAASKALILGFHTQVERHADQLIKEMGVQVRTHDIIYHAIDDVKEMMTGLLDKVAIEEERGKAEVRATFSSSQHGVIAGCYVTEGTIHRNHKIRIVRDGNTVWTGPLSSIRRVKEDVREVQKGVECGLLLEGTNDIQEGDILEAFEVVYIEQEL